MNKWKTDAGGARYDGDGNLLTGRKPGSKNKKPAGVRITITVRPETKDWIDRQPLSKGKMIDKLVLGRLVI